MTPVWIRGVLRAASLRVALIALLLAAQHGALTHALMHAQRLAQGGSIAHASSAPSAHGHDSHDRQATESCAFDLVYTQVLGGLHSGHVPVVAASGHLPVAAAAIAVHSALTVVPYQSRAPPVLS